MYSKRSTADLALILCALIWGATFVVVQNALVDASVLVFIALRFSIAALFMRIVFWRSLRGMRVGTLWAGVQIGFFLLGGFVLQTAGLKFTTPSNAAFITGLSVVLVPVLLAAFGSRKIGVWIWAGAISSFAGLYFLAVPPSGFAALNRGDLLVFGCAIMFALQFIFVGRYTKSHPVGALSFASGHHGGRGSDIDAAVFIRGMGEAATGLDASLVHGSADHLSWGDGDLLLVADVGPAPHFSGANGHLADLEPVFAALISWRLGREHFGVRTMLGAVLILIGILLAECKGQETPGAEAIGDT